MYGYLERVLELAKRTGDRVIVVDQKNPEDSYVVMNFDEYERLIDDFEEDFDAEDFDWNDTGQKFADISEEDDKINELSDFEEDYEEEENFNISPKLDNHGDYGRINTDFTRSEEPEQRVKKRWEIAEDIKQAGQEEFPNFSQEDDSEDDDRYYLETI